MRFYAGGGELTGASQDQSALQETRLSLNGFQPSSKEQQTGQKRSYTASLLSVAAPRCLSVRDPEPLSKVAKVSEGDSADPFVSALLASKDEAKKHASNVTVVDEIPPPAEEILDIVCGISIKISRKSLMFISDRAWRTRLITN